MRFGPLSGLSGRGSCEAMSTTNSRSFARLRKVTHDGGVELRRRELPRGRRRTLQLHGLLVDHAVLDVAVDDRLPLLGQGAPLARQRLVEPLLHGREQRPLADAPVGVEVLQGAARQDQAHRRTEDLAQVDVDRVADAVEVDVLVHVEARVEKGAQRRERALVERETVGGAERVVDEALGVDRADRDAAHVGVAAHVVEVVDRHCAGEGAVKEADPAGDGVGALGRFGGGSGGVRRPFRRPVPRLGAHEKGDVPRVDRLALGERTARAAAERPQQLADLVDDEVLRDALVVEPEDGLEVLLVAEVAERPVPDVVQQAGEAHRLFHEGQRGSRRLDLAQRRVDGLREQAGEVHHAEAVREAAVLGGREDPPRALQLVDALEPLHPRAVDHVGLGDLAGARQGDAEVPVERVGDQVDVVVGQLHRRPTPSVPRPAPRRRARARSRRRRGRSAPRPPGGTPPGRCRRCARPPRPSRRRCRRRSPCARAR